MKYILLFIILFLISFSSFSQENDEVRYARYSYLNSYHKYYKTTLTKKDSLNFMFRDKDTLVLITKDMQAAGSFVDYVHKDSTFLSYYKKVAFNHKNDSLDHATTMKYWKNDIKLFFAKSVSRKEKKSILKFTENISNKVDSLNIYEAKNHADSNYVIYSSNDYEYEKNLKNIKNADFWIYWNNDNQLNKGFIKINKKKYSRQSLRIEKIKILLFQSLGYFKLSDEFDCNSYLSNCYSESKQITDFDYELLQYHYCYGICKGNSLRTFEAKHEEVQKILSKSDDLYYRFHYPNN
ncbi:hypothetical protein [Psychroserpens sp.]|jgi:hypothetical protein|uniref:hypothetical protein n=1 Tax=Psychroserpens sp. TaxID=2020870 RepID=UPI0039E29460